MSWVLNLYKTYENNRDSVGVFEKKQNNQEFALIPLSHTTQSAHIDVSLDDSGNFVLAKVVDKNDASTIIPCTESSAGRGNGSYPHALFDKLIYVAGDFEAYGGEVKTGSPHVDYMKQLKEWCDSPFAHPKVQCVYNYLDRGTLIRDLVREQIVFVDDDEKFIEKWDKRAEDKFGDKPELFKVLASDQSAAFVRFSVNVIGDAESRLWRDATVRDSYVQYYEMKLKENDICFVTGRVLPFADKHTSRIRDSRDMSKLISANDTKGFTFRGRFQTSRDAVSISYEASQKAHNALKWLIARQGHQIDGRVFLAWGTGEQDQGVPDVFDEPSSIYGDIEEVAGDSTHQEFARQINRAISGYRHDFDYQSNVIIMILDAATSGRMSIVYYRELDKQIFLERVQQWYSSCYWMRWNKVTSNGHYLSLGTPSMKDIAFAAYGSKANDKIVKNLMERMLPSVIDERKIPLDIVRSATARATNPLSMEEKPWEWEKTLSIACALIRKVHEKEGFDVALDDKNSDRDYLFGRMLAIADVLERRAMDKDEKRATNAVRYMNAFAQRPGRTWTIIQSNLQVYQAKLGTKVGYYNRLLDEVGAQLNVLDYTDKPLSGKYLLGFYSQRHELKDWEAEQANKENGQGDN